MLVLGLQGSPRKKGNTFFLLDAFLSACRDHGAVTRQIDVDRKNILPCKEYVVCEKKGYCPIDDDMPSEIYPLLRSADIIIAATPIFFYGPTAQLKALIDRCQTFWARKYRLKLTDPGAGTRKGYLLSVGATRGRTLFDAVELIGKYFFDAVDADYAGSLFYHGIEHFGDMKRHPDVAADVKAEAGRLMAPFSKRPTVLFLGRGNSGASQMAAAFARRTTGDRFDVVTAGTHPDGDIAPAAEAAMAEIGVDLAFLRPVLFSEAVDHGRPDVIVTIDGAPVPPVYDDLPRVNLPVPRCTRTASPEQWRSLRDGIAADTRRLLDSLDQDTLKHPNDPARNPSGQA